MQNKVIYFILPSSLCLFVMPHAEHHTFFVVNLVLLHCFPSPIWEQHYKKQALFDIHWKLITLRLLFRTWCS